MPPQVAFSWSGPLPVAGGALIARKVDSASAAGAVGMLRCHAASASAASAHAKVSPNVVRSGVGWVRKVNSVAIPKLPPPPPRQAQNSAGSVRSSQVTTLPSASTTLAESIESTSSPPVRVMWLKPPPSASPPTPTVGHVPVGIASPAPRIRSS